MFSLVTKMTVFWNVAPCSLVEIDRCFRATYCLHHQCDLLIAVMTEAVSSSETSTRLHGRRQLHTCSLKNLKSQFSLVGYDLGPYVSRH
jgi:hypothetical protein